MILVHKVPDFVQMAIDTGQREWGVTSCNCEHQSVNTNQWRMQEKWKGDSKVASAQREKFGGYSHFRSHVVQ